MSRNDEFVRWPVRIARVGAAFIGAAAILVWIMPVNVRGQGGVHFGCGSPADPRGGGELVDLVCRTDLDFARAIALALLVAAALLLLLSEVLFKLLKRRSWVWGLVAVAPLALPLVAVSATALIVTVGGSLNDGSPFRCGSAIAPASDALSLGVCGQKTEARLASGLGGILMGLGLLGAGAYVVQGSARTDAIDSASDEEVRG